MATLSLCALIGCSAFGAGKIPIKVLIIAKFEVGEMSGDKLGEAQLYFEHYLEGAETYEIEGTAEGNPLYVKDGIALFVTGEGKTNAASGTLAVLTDERFDFSEAYILSTGCCGASYGYGVMGDVYVISGSFDYDLGHHADVRDMGPEPNITWFHENTFDDSACVELDADLTERVFELVKDVPLETTELTRETLMQSFPDEDWATCDPQVMRGTSATGDNYWKGDYDHSNALYMNAVYGLGDPFVCADMEDVAVGVVVERLGMLDHYICIRDAVNIDVFLLDDTPEALWSDEYRSLGYTETASETIDIFDVSMQNNFRVGQVIIDAILAGEL